MKIEIAKYIRMDKKRNGEEARENHENMEMYKFNKLKRQARHSNAIYTLEVRIKTANNSNSRH